MNKHFSDNLSAKLAVAGIWVTNFCIVIATLFSLFLVTAAFGFFGFLLVESAEQPTIVVDEKHTLNTVEVGDTVECISTENPGYHIGELYTEEGKLYTVSRVEYLKDVDKIKVHVKEEDGGIGIMDVNYKFHSRPVVN